MKAKGMKKKDMMSGSKHKMPGGMMMADKEMQYMMGSKAPAKKKAKKK